MCYDILKPNKWLIMINGTNDYVDDMPSGKHTRKLWKITIFNR